MSYTIQWFRSLLFNIQMYLALAVIGGAFLIPMLVHRRFAYMACHSFCWWVIWTARWMIGLKVEIRGTPPTDAVLVAAKHQSFFDIIVIFNAVPRGKFIMKRLLMFTPVVGQYSYRIGCIPVSRGGRAKAIRKMSADVAAGKSDPGQLVIYPQGTRVAPGADVNYKVGSGVLYRNLKQPCIPVALNIGVFWPRRGVYRKPGTAIVEFLPAIQPGLSVHDFMEELETTIETRSDALMAESGFIQQSTQP